MRAPDTSVTIRDNLFGVKYYANCGRYVAAHIAPANAGGPNFTWKNNVWYAPGDARHGAPVVS